MKVGDLVKRKERNWHGLILATVWSMHHIKILDEEGSVYWERSSEYEVISESRRLGKV